VRVAAWEGTRDAGAFGATAQRGDPGITLIPEPSIPGDGTLNVNVVTPDREPPGFRCSCGSTAEASSPARPPAPGTTDVPSRDGAVTVTISYRLGVDGFGHIDGAPSNRGVRDWLAALEWVQENIAAFGGDPARVTIAGQSAGGGAVLTLLGMPSAQHLFHRVWSLSAALGDVEPERARALTAAIAAAAGVSADRDGFASIPEERLLALQKQATAIDPKAAAQMLAAGLALGPEIDGELLPRATGASFAAGVGADKPLVLGTTDDEFTMIFARAARAMRWVPGASSSVVSGWNDDGAAPTSRPTATSPRTGRRASPVAISPTACSERRTCSSRMRAVRRPPGCTDSRGRRGASIRGALPRRALLLRLSGCRGHRAAGGRCAAPQLADAVHADAVAFVAGGDPGWTRWSAAQAARIYDVPVSERVGAYASVAPLR
jgi:para-nitrobenzyl esterase